MIYNKIASIKEQIATIKAESLKDVEDLRIKFLGKKGLVTELFNDFREVPNEMKREVGALVNDLKNQVQEFINAEKERLGNVKVAANKPDLTLQSEPIEIGSRHPISLIKNELYSIFQAIGYKVVEGPEIEDDWHVFSSLNFPPEHPARDMQDTFFIEKNPDILLRTHTSSVQVRAMETSKPPIRVICPGRVFRNEAISARAHCIFHQVEGLYIDKNVSFADLKQTLLYLARELFGADTKIRLRPSFFPFTEPSAEVDVSCKLCGGKGCGVCKYTGWLEVLGCGMVDPNVLRYNNIDPEVYSGFAFGVGVERLAMLKYQVKDLRLYFENDVRFLEQFHGVI
ncbi:MAG: phenylalanine--tRNA ligase subunit alpha [Bacteroidales bacterium]|nr:phenylalanine--tRNA ligase subunit alpha [Bacteroidales bacterium]MBN2750052.1 phenylalanine--tRNA ligase subunit alpha [Bacteroidales bacterium]